MHDKKNKIAFLIAGLNAGGIENNLLSFIKYLKNVENIVIIVKNNNKGDLYYSYLETGVRIVFQKIGYFNFINWIKLFLLFRKEKYDIIFDYTGNFGGIPIFIGYIAGIKERIVFYARSSNAFKKNTFKLFYNKIMNLLVYYFSTKILSNSFHAIDFFFPYRKINDKRFDVIPNPINLKNFQSYYPKADIRRLFNLPINKFIIGHVGRYNVAKNHKTIFSVAQLLRNYVSNVVFVFAGKGTDSAEFLSELDHYGIRDICYCYGTIDNVNLLYKAFDLFFFPSITEGQPTALIEAMVSGLPVVTSNIPSIKEIIPERGYQYLVSPENVHESLNLILAIITKKIPSNFLCYKKEIILKFNYNKPFKLFYNKLLK